MSIEEAISILKQYIDYNNPDIPDFYTMEEACKVVIEALENQPTDAVDRVTIKEYLDSFGKETNVTTTSELSSIRHELLERKDELVSFGQLIERFDDVDAEYGGSPWTLEQIYANFNILIGIESVESPSYNGVKTELIGDADCIRRSDVCFTNFEIVMCNGDYKEGLKMLLDKIEKAPSVTPMPKMGAWEWLSYEGIDEGNWHCSECRMIIPRMPIDDDGKPLYKCCPFCGSKNRGMQNEN